ncbi:MAG: adenine phosphoribosyltransferase [Pseudomonadota bacterium]
MSDATAATPPDPLPPARPDLAVHIRTIPDFPVPGVQFRDVTTLFAQPAAFAEAVAEMATSFAARQPQAIAGMDARGFILGGAIAYRLALPFVPVRKKGKLPGATLSEAYSLEYGEAIVEVHADAVEPGTRVLLVDDLLATGGTAAAGVSLLRRLQAEVVGASFMVDLPDLGGAARLRALGVQVHTLCAFDGD